MMSIAYPMRRDEREAVAKFLGTGTDEPAPPASAFCKADRPIMSAPPRESWTGWGPSHSQHAISSAERGGPDAPAMSAGLSSSGRSGFPAT